MSRGGKREGAGRTHKWFMGDTTTIRIPAIFKDKVLDIVTQWDDEIKSGAEKKARELINNATLEDKY